MLNVLILKKLGLLYQCLPSGVGRHIPLVPPVDGQSATSSAPDTGALSLISPEKLKVNSIRGNVTLPSYHIIPGQEKRRNITLPSQFILYSLF